MASNLADRSSGSRWLVDRNGRCRMRYEPAGFKASLGLKDLRLTLAAGEALGVPLPTASLVSDQLSAAIAEGQGDFDWSVIARLAAQRAGL
jgi:3-hydroxyisobutyrate dehydrogenase-like beta-hydroxyacid dehydrogenase